MNKKALSPIITTILLVLIATVLAVIIFMWAVAFKGEQITKFIGGEEKDISISCEAALFDVELAGDNLAIVNTGDIPIYRFDLRVQGNVRSEIINEKGRINPGEATTIPSHAVSGDELHVIPVLLGTDKDGAEKEASCINAERWEIVKV